MKLTKYVMNLRKVYVINVCNKLEWVCKLNTLLFLLEEMIAVLIEIKP